MFSIGLKKIFTWLLGEFDFITRLLAFHHLQYCLPVTVTSLYGGKKHAGTNFIFEKLAVVVNLQYILVELQHT